MKRILIKFDDEIGEIEAVKYVATALAELPDKKGAIATPAYGLMAVFSDYTKHPCIYVLKRQQVKEMEEPFKAIVSMNKKSV